MLPAFQISDAILSQISYFLNSLTVAPPIFDRLTLRLDASNRYRGTRLQTSMVPSDHIIDHFMMEANTFFRRRYGPLFRRKVTGYDYTTI